MIFFFFQVPQKPPEPTFRFFSFFPIGFSKQTAHPFSLDNSSTCFLCLGKRRHHSWAREYLVEVKKAFGWHTTFIRGKMKKDTLEKIRTKAGSRCQAQDSQIPRRERLIGLT